MTGLDPENDRLVEIALIVTDYKLKPLHPGFSTVINPGERALRQMNPFVTRMHEKSGLLPHIRKGETVQQAEQKTLRYLQNLAGENTKPVIAGNTIGTDRRFIAREMPLLNDALHYRSIDVSSIKTLVKQWYPRAYWNSPDKAGQHRALQDIAESIRELAYFKLALLPTDKKNNPSWTKPSPEKLAAAKKQAEKNYANLLDNTRVVDGT